MIIIMEFCEGKQQTWLN